MKITKILFALSGLGASLLTQAQSTAIGDTCSFGRFAPGLTSFAFASTNTTQITYGVNTTTNIARVYTPTGDVNTCRPVIIWAHGGGFTTGSYLEQKTTDMMTQFARKGYVAITMRYRLWPTTPANNQQYQEALIRGVQDMVAAIRFVRANASAFGADTSQIFVGGSSAGAIIANHTAFMDQSEAFPLALSNQGGNYNVSTPTVNLSQPYNVAGCVTQAGSLWDLNFLTGETIPFGAVHNTSDATVPHNTGGGSQQIFNQLQSQNVKSFLKLTYSPGLHTPFPATPSAPYVDTFNVASYTQLYAMLKHNGASSVTVNSTTLTASPGGLAYQWYLNNSAVSGATLQTLVASSSGNYKVVTRNCTNCFSTSNTVSVTLVTTKLNSFAFDNALELFPSPCKSFLQIKHGGDVETINIYTVTGNKLIEISKPDKTYTLNTNDWPSGLYFAEILSNNKNIKTIKFIKSE
ncbi:MAG: carboxylesterase family protein [Bacteroidota bacterium]